LKKYKKSTENREILFKVKYMLFVILKICQVSQKIISGAKNHLTSQAKIAVFSSF